MTEGRVRVNGAVVTELGSKVDPARDVVTVDGVTVSIAERPRYLMLYKPAGYLTTMSDPHGRPTVAELVPVDEAPGLYPVGRLDLDTTGASALHHQRSMGQALLHPSRHVTKHYVALVTGTPDERDLARLEAGVMLEDGRAGAPRAPSCSRRAARSLASSPRRAPGKPAAASPTPWWASPSTRAGSTRSRR